MLKIYLAGQNNFGNRGCEALVRATAKLVASKYPSADILVPTHSQNLDQKQWPDASKYGVTFVKAIEFPRALIWWARISRIIPKLEKYYLPKYEIPEFIKKDIEECDMVLLIGGDNFTLDYGIPSLFWNVRLAEFAVHQNIPTMLWACSAGPFSRNTYIESYMSKFLNKLSAITVRETESLSYFKSIGVYKNVTLVADPAFVLDDQIANDQTMNLTHSAQGIVGFNVSYLIVKFLSEGKDLKYLQSEIVNFIKWMIDQENYSVLLIPHVDPLDGVSVNSDSAFMEQIFKKLDMYKDNLKLVPNNLNAAELKFIISKCRFFIGARTHATIAALSKEVPTLSIAYSVKAKGLNKDLFGDTRYVLDTSDISCKSLQSGFEKLIEDEDSIKSILNTRIPVWKENAYLSAEKMVNCLNR